jgi:hypothetical protein
MAMGIIWFILLGSLYLFSAIILFNTSPVLSSLIVFIGVVHLVFRGVKPALSRVRLVRKTRRAVGACIREHLPVLARKRAKHVKKDDYGIVHYEEWEQEKEYFITVVKIESFPGILSEEFPLSPGHIDAMMENAIDDFVEDVYGDASFNDPGEEDWEDDDRHSLRQYCVGLLTLAGWKVVSEDEDEDEESPILAERDENLLVVICVDSPSPVGWRVVRRASKARKKLRAQMTAVVTVGYFSRWARMASSRYRVMPLHPEDLANI